MTKLTAPQIAMLRHIDTHPGTFLPGLGMAKVFSALVRKGLAAWGGTITEEGRKALTINPTPLLTKAQRKARKEKARGERVGPQNVDIISIWPDAVTIVL